MDAIEDRGAPYVIVPAKRPFDNVPVQADWHDYVINRRRTGVAVVLDFRMRPLRDDATGLQYRATTGGVTSRKPWFEIAWPRVVGGTVSDGSVIWTAEAMASNSLRASIVDDDWPAVTGLTLTNESVSDFVYTVFVAGGIHGSTYEVRHRVTLAGTSAEAKEGLIILPVRD